MRILLDTHSFLWFAGGDERLSLDARRVISDVGNEAYLSTASLWEMAIKINSGQDQYWETADSDAPGSAGQGAGA
jgi:PIN domain nuclease of toxin-antitoxin system